MQTFTLGKSEEQVLEMIPEKLIHKIHLGEEEIAMVRMGKIFHAFQATCPHRGSSLIEGSLSADGEIICSLHNYRFDLATGEVKASSCSNLEIYSTELTDAGLKIFISLK